MGLKNRSQFSSTLDNNLKEKLSDLSKETKIPISKLLDESIELLLEQRGSQRTIKKSANQRSEDKFYVDIDLD